MASLFGIPDTVGTPTPPEDNESFNPAQDDAAIRRERAAQMEAAGETPSREEYMEDGFLRDFAITGINGAALNALPVLNSLVYGTARASRTLPFAVLGGAPGGFREALMSPGQMYASEFNKSMEFFGGARDRLTRLGGEEPTIWGNIAAGTADAAGTMPGAFVSLAGKGVGAAMNLGRFVTGMRTAAASDARYISDNLAQTISKYAPAEALDRWLLGSQSYGSSLKEATRRVVASGVAATGPGLAQDIMLGGVDPNDYSEVAMSVLVNGAMGAGGQAILGEAFEPFMRMMSSDRNVNRFNMRVLDALPLQEGPGVTTKSYRDMVRDLPEGATLFGMRSPGPEMVNGITALNRAIADVAFPGVAPNQVGELDRQIYLQQYQNLQAQAMNAAQDTMDGVQARLQTAIGEAPSRRQMLERTAGNKAHIAPLYDEMTTTRQMADGNMPLGAQPFDRVEFVRSVRARFEDELGANIETSALPNEQILALFENSLKLSPEGARRMDDVRYNNLAPDGAPRQIPLAMLMTRGRQAVADRLRPQLTDGYGPEHRAAAARLLRVIDQEIEATQLGRLPEEARKAWGEQLRLMDAHDLGSSFFRSRMQGGAYDLAAATSDNLNDPLYSANLEEYYALLNNMEGGEEVKQAFRDGFTNEMSNFVDRHKIGAALNAWLGDVDMANPGQVYFNSRPGEERILRTIMGDEPVDILLSAANEQHILDAQQKLVEFFRYTRREGHTPTDDMSLPMEAINAGVVMGMNGPAQRGGLIGNGLAAFSEKIYGDSGLAQSREVMEFLTSPRELLLRRLDNSLSQIEEPELRRGASFALVDPDTADDDERQVTRNNIENDLNEGASIFRGNIDQFNFLTNDGLITRDPPE